jgi:hypothetical protein
MFPDTRNKNIHVYGLWVGISTISKLLEHLGFRGTGPFHMVMISIPSNAPSHNEQEYIWLMGGDLHGFQYIRVPLRGTERCVCIHKFLKNNGICGTKFLSPQ